MWNLVSEMVVGSEDMVEWYCAINNFVAIPRFIPPGLDSRTHEGFPAFGPNNDLLPLDVNVTFFFDYDKGTIETVEIFNRTESGTDNSLGNLIIF